MRHPWVNIILFALLIIQLISGYLGFVNAVEQKAWLLWLHGVGAYAIIMVFLWKGAVIWDVWGRGKSWTWRRVSFVVLLLLLCLVLLLGVLWSFGGLAYLFGFSLLSLHIYVAVPLLFLLGYHAWRMRWILRRPRATDRRALLRGLTISAAAGALWWLARPLTRARRFTGSYEVGSFGGSFPRVSWINDDPAPIEGATWQLRVAGRVAQPLTLSYQTLLARAGDEITATIDCTGGWYSTQVWRGIAVATLLQQARVLPEARSVKVISVTGYWRRFDLEEIGDALLATHVAGEPLSHGHGFPLRLIVPDKRGFAWVKWITALEVETVSPWWQPPLPLQ
jgi:DMSO/TMAO reductase YedYZ molybdopterin-dependent catalytic subunit